MKDFMTSENKNTHKLQFSKILQQKLMERFGRIPSANHFANQYNLRANGTEPITQEAARRWIKGLSIPQVERFQILSNWLGIRPQDFLETTDESNFSSHKSAMDIRENNLIDIFRSLNTSEQHALQVAAKTMLEAKNHH